MQVQSAITKLCQVLADCWPVLKIHATSRWTFVPRRRIAPSALASSKVFAASKFILQVEVAIWLTLGDRVASGVEHSVAALVQVCHPRRVIACGVWDEARSANSCRVPLTIIQTPRCIWPLKSFTILYNLHSWWLGSNFAPRILKHRLKLLHSLEILIRIASTLQNLQGRLRVAAESSWGYARLQRSRIVATPNMALVHIVAVACILALSLKISLHSILNTFSIIISAATACIISTARAITNTRLHAFS